MKYLVLFVLSALIILFWEGLKAHVHPYLYSVITPIHYCENRKDTASVCRYAAGLGWDVLGGAGVWEGGLGR